MKLISIALALSLCGCISSAPTSFIDADSLRPHYVGEGYRAFAHDYQLTIEVDQTGGYNVFAFDVQVYDGALYVSPQRISSGPGGVSTFKLDVSKLGLAADWPERTYWLVAGDYGYPLVNPRFWSAANRSDPWVRHAMEIAVQ